MLYDTGIALRKLLRDVSKICPLWAFKSFLSPEKAVLKLYPLYPRHS